MQKPAKKKQKVENILVLILVILLSQTSFELLQGKLGIGNGVISSCMKVPLLNDFAVLLSVYTKLVSSPKIKEMTLREVKEFFEGRMIYRKEYFENNSDIKNAYQFAKAVLEHYSNL